MRAIVAYFTVSGHTQAAAEAIAKALNADLERIEAAKPVPSSMFGLLLFGGLAASRKRPWTARPTSRKPSDYDLVIINTPVWAWTPAWTPGTRQAYHALTLEFYEGELLRRIDPQHRSLGQFFQDEIATPLGLDIYIRLPESILNTRLAPLASPNQLAMLFGFPIRLTLDPLNPHSNIYRALIANPGASICEDEQRIYARNLEVPSGGGVGTARAIAHAYSEFATDGRRLQLRPETLQAVAAPATPATHGFYDECLRGEVRFSLGFMKPSPFWPFGGDRSFGAPGSGGALGFADPDAGIGYAYVTSQMGTTLTETRGTSRCEMRCTPSSQRSQDRAIDPTDSMAHCR